MDRLARGEGLDLRARPGNPTDLGIHNKMILARTGGRGYVHGGSFNGSEVSSKVNRKIAPQVPCPLFYTERVHCLALFGALCYDYGTSIE
jgi:hypothetical protein